MNHAIDCFGYLFDENLAPCREHCQARRECREALAQNLRRSGAEIFESRKRRLLSQSARLAKTIAIPQSLTPEISETVSRVVELLASLGLKPVFKRYYIAFKDAEGRSQLHVSRFRSDTMNKLVRFVRPVTPDDLSEPCRSVISRETICGQRYFTGESLHDLSEVVKVYLEGGA
ncbi:MAG: hypothetical protein HY696_03970 [Deltaproteobacteria bacterium]|nr:hypothetical protein [Deltaproteobacteria bacterium]